MNLINILKQKLMPFIKLVFVGIVLSLSVLSSIQVPASAQKISDLNILGIRCIFPGQAGCSGGNLFDNILEFMLNLAPVLAILVIMWGGYKYFFGALSGDNADGKKTILAGVTGLIIVLSAKTIQTVVKGSVTSSGFSAGALSAFISDISTFLFTLATVISVLVITWGGYKYLFSGLPGDQKDGLDTIRNGIIGLIIVLLAIPIKNIVQLTIGGGEKLNLSTGEIVKTATNLITGFLIPVSTVAAVFFIVLGAYYYITARGDDNLVKKGRDAIRNAVIGLVIALLSTTIVQLVFYFVPVKSSMIQEQIHSDQQQPSQVKIA
ncbi:MAG: pilin [bacterium]